MVYMAGDNTLSRYVAVDINEMEQGLYDAVNSGNNQLESVLRVVVLADMGSTSDTALYLIEPDDTDEVVSKMLNVDFIPDGELNMADPGSLTDFVSYSLENFPSVYNALVIWNHGGGVRSIEPDEQASKAICEDDGDILYLNEVQSALSSAVDGESFDIIGIDACLMGEVETAYEMRSLADYFVASMASEWGAGWGYKYIFDNFISSENPPLPADMADILVSQFYESTTGRVTGWPNTMTAVDTSALGALKTAIDNLAKAIHIYGGGNTAENEFEALRDASVFYYEPRPSNVAAEDNDAYEEQILAYPYYDLYDFCINISNSLVFDDSVKTQAAAVLSALDAAVVAAYGDSSSVDTYYSDTREPLGLNYYDTEDGSAVRGLSIFIPHGELTWPYNSTEYSHYAYDWWYTSDVLTDYTPSQGGIDFCTYDSDGTVETWRELFEAWYDPSNQYTDGSY